MIDITKVIGALNDLKDGVEHIKNQVYLDNTGFSKNLMDAKMSIISAIHEARKYKEETSMKKKE